jgi:hypothetical protein
LNVEGGNEVTNLFFFFFFCNSQVAAKVEFFEANPDKEAKEEWTKKREKASKEASRKVAAKPKSQKVVFRFSKEAKDFFKK